MALNKVFLNKVSLKSIYDRYTYTTGDTLAECLVDGYFEGAPFDLSSPTNPIVEIDAIDGDTITAIRLSDYVAVGVPLEILGMPAAADVTSAVNSVSDSKLKTLSYSALTTTLSNIDNGANNATYLQMIMVPMDYSVIRIGWVHKGGNGALTNLEMLIASTDDIGDLLMTPSSLDSKKFLMPQKAGTEYNSLSYNGWHAVTWGGSSTLTVADPTGSNFTTSFSDLIDLSSVPMIDNYGGRFEGWRALLVRCYPGSAYWSRGAFTGFNSVTKFLSDTGANLVLGASRFGGNYVSNIAGWTSALTPNFSSSDIMPIILEAHGSGGGKSVIISGDSRFTVSAGDTTGEQYNTTAFKLENLGITRDDKFKVITVGQGGRTTDEYYQWTKNILSGSDEHLQPTHSVYLIYSINDGLPTDEIIANSKAKLVRHIKDCIDNKIVPVLISSFPVGGGLTTDEKAILDDLDSYAENIGYPWLSPLQIYGDENGDWARFDYDGNHMTDAGYDDLAARILVLIR